jgi:hypothetical protein
MGVDRVVIKPCFLCFHWWRTVFPDVALTRVGRRECSVCSLGAFSAPFTLVLGCCFFVRSTCSRRRRSCCLYLLLVASPLPTIPATAQRLGLSLLPRRPRAPSSFVPEGVFCASPLPVVDGAMLRRWVCVSQTSRWGLLGLGSSACLLAWSPVLAPHLNLFGSHEPWTSNAQNADKAPASLPQELRPLVRIDTLADDGCRRMPGVAATQSRCSNVWTAAGTSPDTALRRRCLCVLMCSVGRVAV